MCFVILEPATETGDREKGIGPETGDSPWSLAWSLVIASNKQKPFSGVSSTPFYGLAGDSSQKVGAPTSLSLVQGHLHGGGRQAYLLHLLAFSCTLDPRITAE